MPDEFDIDMLHQDFDDLDYVRVSTPEPVKKNSFIDKFNDLVMKFRFRNREVIIEEEDPNMI